MSDIIKLKKSPCNFSLILPTHSLLRILCYLDEFNMEPYIFFVGLTLFSEFSETHEIHSRMCYSIKKYVASISPKRI